MIGKLTGRVDALGEDAVVLDVQGVGYLVQAGARTLSRLPAPGEAASLTIETHVREDAIRLYGFLSEEERAWFVRLQDVQGVGARVALAILDVMAPGDISAAASIEDKAAFSRASGVGPRLAQRLAGELKGKPPPATRFGALASPAPAPAAAAAAAGGQGAAAVEPGDDDLRLRADAVSALANLGLDPAAARAAVAAARAGFDAPPALDDLVKAALKEMGR